MSKKVSVYGKTADGGMQLIKRGIPEEDAKKLVDSYWMSTGRTACIVLSE